MSAPSIDPLVELLRRADAAAPPPAARLAAAALVRPAAGRRRFGPLAAAALMFAGLAWLLLAPGSPEPTVLPMDVAVLQGEAEARLQALDRMRARARQARLERRIEALARRLPAPRQAERLLDEAAAALAWRAERLLPSERAEAARLYRAIAADYPETRWSAIAADRLAVIESIGESERNQFDSKENER